MDWTAEMVDALRRLWGEGHSASYIAVQLGGISRNAVIGKAHRLHLSARPSPIRRTGSMSAAAGGKTCSWPVGDPKQNGFHFCGDPVEAGRPYCTVHCESAYHKKPQPVAA